VNDLRRWWAGLSPIYKAVLFSLPALMILFAAWGDWSFVAVLFVVAGVIVGRGYIDHRRSG